jgi:hypothetical protein
MEKSNQDMDGSRYGKKYDLTLTGSSKETNDETTYNDDKQVVLGGSNKGLESDGKSHDSSKVNDDTRTGN